jgi:hypothetical protein
MLNLGPRRRAAAREPTARVPPRWTVAAKLRPTPNDLVGSTPAVRETAVRRVYAPAARRAACHERCAVRDDQPRLCAPTATSATGAAAALASAPGRRPAEAGASISWLPGRRSSHVRWRAPATRLRLEHQSVDRFAGGCFCGRAGTRWPPVSAAQIRPLRAARSAVPLAPARRGKAARSSCLWRFAHQPLAGDFDLIAARRVLCDARPARRAVRGGQVARPSAAGGMRAGITADAPVGRCRRSPSV